MPIKKSDLYSSIWASCDELRGGMDASQYKDYVLFMLFIKYITDKYGNSSEFAPPDTIPKGASFRDMIALKGKPDIGDKINTQIIQPLIDANARLGVTAICCPSLKTMQSRPCGSVTARSLSACARAAAWRSGERSCTTGTRRYCTTSCRG
jgi:hypothetical protein